MILDCTRQTISGGIYNLFDWKSMSFRKDEQHCSARSELELKDSTTSRKGVGVGHMKQRSYVKDYSEYPYMFLVRDKHRSTPKPISP